MLTGASAYISASASEAIVSAGGGTDNHGDGISLTLSLVDGTGVGKAQKVGSLLFTTSTTIANLDLTAFLGGINAAAINFTKLKWLIFQNLDTTNNIVLTFSGTNGNTNIATGTITLQPGESVVFLSQVVGFTVDATHKIIGVTASAATPQIKMTIVGEGT